MRDEYDVQEQIENRMRGVRLLVAHAILGLLMFYGVLLGGALEQIRAEFAVLAVLTILFSLLGHGIWLGLREYRSFVLYQELERDRRLSADKLKRETNDLVVSDDGEMSPQFEPDEGTQEKMRR